MKLFLDTADTELIEKYFQTDLIDGITTNPTLIMKSGRNPEDVYQQLIDLGSKIIGGCCEITPSHISKLKKLKC